MIVQCKSPGANRQCWSTALSNIINNLHCFYFMIGWKVCDVGVTIESKVNFFKLIVENFIIISPHDCVIILVSLHKGRCGVMLAEVDPLSASWL